MLAEYLKMILFYSPLGIWHVFMPPPFIMGGGGGGGHIASPLSVRTKNGFRAISFENIGVLDSYFIHRYIIIKYRSS